MTEPVSTAPKLKPFYKRWDVLLSILLVVAAREASSFFAWNSFVLWVAVVIAVVVCARAAFITIRAA